MGQSVVEDGEKLIQCHHDSVVILSSEANQGCSISSFGVDSLDFSSSRLLQGGCCDISPMSDLEDRVRDSVKVSHVVFPSGTELPPDGIAAALSEQCSSLTFSFTPFNACRAGHSTTQSKGNFIADFGGGSVFPGFVGTGQELEALNLEDVLRSRGSRFTVLPLLLQCATAGQERITLLEEATDPFGCLTPGFAFDGVVDVVAIPVLALVDASVEADDTTVANGLQDDLVVVGDDADDAVAVKTHGLEISR